ncbi:F-box/FBD/LRR-repeat protein At1g13570-like isoform X2 [Rhododendron vialii]|uniref:F-box/FBD/LRR-repeat protein At1g13570-like isoform X2 n=1 Tax=Rhododendron vialii TaxID=182163 RepID=UPI00265E420D|nr:F-box/FBD/LRR-repeat protein At1g13570-like isoform X2 [Rhododendron vialii]
MTSSHFEGKDIISDLPRNIIESILQRMPVRDAARTSILSSKWRYFWTTISQLVLDNQFFEETLRIKPIVQLELAKAVEKILLLHNGPIQKFVLCLPVISFNGRSDIDHWILFLSRNGIKDFTLDNSTNTPYEMHSCIYSCRELTRLKLINCIVKPPRELSGFQNVVELHFKSVAFGKNMLRTLLSRSGLLEMLIIYGCSGIGHLNIHARNLELLVLNRNNGIESLSFVDTPKLWWCSISLGMKMESLLRSKTPSSLDFLVDLPRVSILHLDSFFLQFCPTTNTFEELVVNYLEAPACMDQSEQTLAKLISVKINCLKGLKPQLLLIKLLLACSPKLETLFVGLSSRLNESEGFKISKELSQFRRLSPKAAVIY